MESGLSPWRTVLPAAAVIAVGNVVVLGIGHLLGADMLVARSAGTAVTEVGVGPVLLMSVLPTVLGGLALWFVRRRGIRAWRAVGWLGLALGLVTVPMPFVVEASTGTSATLGAMHLVAGLAWFAAVHRTAGRGQRASGEVFGVA